MSSEKSDTWRSSSYCNELQEEDKAKYKLKLTLTNGQLLPDPYGIVENWKSVTKLMPDVSWGDMYNYKIQVVNTLTTTWKLKNDWKPSTFLFAAIFNTFIIMKLQKKSEFCSIKTKVNI